MKNFELVSVNIFLLSILVYFYTSNSLGQAVNVTSTGKIAGVTLQQRQSQDENHQVSLSYNRSLDHLIPRRRLLLDQNGRHKDEKPDDRVDYDTLNDPGTKIASIDPDVYAKEVSNRKESKALSSSLETTALEESTKIDSSPSRLDLPENGTILERPKNIKESIDSFSNSSRSKDNPGRGNGNSSDQSSNFDSTSQRTNDTKTLMESWSNALESEEDDGAVHVRTKRADRSSIDSANTKEEESKRNQRKRAVPSKDRVEVSSKSSLRKREDPKSKEKEAKEEAERKKRRSVQTADKGAFSRGGKISEDKEANSYEGSEDSSEYEYADEDPRADSSALELDEVLDEGLSASGGLDGRAKREQKDAPSVGDRSDADEEAKVARTKGSRGGIVVRRMEDEKDEAGVTPMVKEDKDEYERRAEERIERKIEAIKEDIKREIEENKRIREIEENNARFDELQDRSDDRKVEQEEGQVRQDRKAASKWKRSVTEAGAQIGVRSAVGARMEKKEATEKKDTSEREKENERSRRRDQEDSNGEEKREEGGFDASSRLLRKRTGSESDADTDKIAKEANNAKISTKKREHARQLFLSSEEDNQKQRVVDPILIPEQGSIEIPKEFSSNMADVRMDSKLLRRRRRDHDAKNDDDDEDEEEEEEEEEVANDEEESEDDIDEDEKDNEKRSRRRRGDRKVRIKRNGADGGSGGRRGNDDRRSPLARRKVSWSYRPQNIEDEEDDEGNEFDDDGFEDRTSNLRSDSRKRYAARVLREDKMAAGYASKEPLNFLFFDRARR